MSDHQFRKFPRTHHLMDLGATVSPSEDILPVTYYITLISPRRLETTSSARHQKSTSSSTIQLSRSRKRWTELI